MGASIAGLLIANGHSLTVWNRSASAAEPLVAKGAKAAEAAADAVENAQFVFTMVHDDHALESILFEQGALASIPEGATHVSLSTISVDLAKRLEKEHAGKKQKYVGSPVFGRPNVAAEGKLWLAIGGADEAVEAVLPVLAEFSRGHTIVGRSPAAAHALKLGGNFLITAMIASLSEGMVYAEAQGIDPAVYLEAINSALFQSPFYAAYSKVMLNPPEKVGATVELGVKDMRLFREAAWEAGLRTPLAEVFQQHLNAAVDAGLGQSDWAAGYYEHAKHEARGAK